MQLEMKNKFYFNLFLNSVVETFISIALIIEVLKTLFKKFEAPYYLAEFNARLNLNFFGQKITFDR